MVRHLSSRGRPLPTFWITLLGLLVLNLAWSHPLQAGLVKADRLSLSAPDTVTIGVGDTTVLSVNIDLESGWHVNTNNPRQKYLIPTQLTFDTRPLRVRSIRYPPGETYSFSFSEERLDVYSGTVSIDVVLEAPEDLNPLTLNQRLKLSYQPCSDRQCLRPQNLTLPFDVRIVPRT